MTVTGLVRCYRIPILGSLARRLALILGADIPRKVVIGNNVRFPHNSIGTVIHENTTIEDDVKIYQNVTIGRADIYKSTPNKDYKGVHIKRGACICAGAKILYKNGLLTIGENAVIAANAVVLESVGDNEIWGGIPARRIGYRTECV